MQPQPGASFGAGASPGLQMPGMPLQAAQMAQLRAMQAQQQLMVWVIPPAPLPQCCRTSQFENIEFYNDTGLAKTSY